MLLVFPHDVYGNRFYSAMLRMLRVRVSGT